MTALEFLGQIAVMDRKVHAAMRKVDLFRSMTQRITCSMGGEVVSRTRDVTSNETAVIKLMEAEDNLKALRSEYTELVDEITSVLDQITDEYGGDILTLRFVKMRSMKDIGRDLHLGKTQVNEHYQSSLDELDKILKKSELNRTQPNSTELDRTQPNHFDMV